MNQVVEKCNTQFNTSSEKISEHFTFSLQLREKVIRQEDYKTELVIRINKCIWLKHEHELDKKQRSRKKNIKQEEKNKIKMHLSLEPEVLTKEPVMHRHAEYTRHFFTAAPPPSSS